MYSKDNPKRARVGHAHRRKRQVMAVASTFSAALEFESDTPEHLRVLMMAVRLGQRRLALDMYTIQQWHATMFPHGGAWRTSAVHIAGSDVAFPPAWQVPALMKAYCDDLMWLLTGCDAPVCVCLARQHIRLVTDIHPFSDGNGRIGRCVLNYAAAFAGTGLVALRPRDREFYLSAVARRDERALADLIAQSLL